MTTPAHLDKPLCRALSTAMNCCWLGVLVVIVVVLVGCAVMVHDPQCNPELRIDLIQWLSGGNSCRFRTSTTHVFVDCSAYRTSIEYTGMDAFKVTIFNMIHIVLQ